MPPADEHWTRVKELFEAAVDLEPNERIALLEKECGGDDTLRAEIESLLQADERSGDFIEQPAFAIPHDLFPDLAKEPFAGRRGASCPSMALLPRSLIMSAGLSMR